MTLILAGADIRGYYAALGIHIQDWAQNNASVRCFADPDRHRRGDRDPSCSINLEHGAWNCHACGAKGGAYDAATVRGYAPRDAIDLMVAFGLTQHRVHRRSASHRAHASRQRVRYEHRPKASRQKAVSVSELDVATWTSNLIGNQPLLHRLEHARCWSYDAMRAIGLGLDREQVTIPTRDSFGALRGLLRYRPWPKPGESKLVAAPGSHRILLPDPLTETSPWVLLVEGEPDMIAARSCGLPAIAIPGAASWRSEWGGLLAGRYVSVVADADEQGRRLAHQVARDLDGIAQARVVDLAPDRRDGYDLTDWLLADGRKDLLCR